MKLKFRRHSHHIHSILSKFSNCDSGLSAKDFNVCLVLSNQYFMVFRFDRASPILRGICQLPVASCLLRREVFSKNI